jgi:type II secretory pathway pseudopilin PulG
MLVVMTILSIMIGALTSLLVAGMKLESYTAHRYEAQQNARLALDKLRREIHCASAVPLSTASSMTFTVGGYCPTADGVRVASVTISPGTYTIAVPSTAAFPAPSGSPPTIKVYVVSSTKSSGRIDCAGAAGGQLTGCQGGFADTYTAAKVAATQNYTWCTQGSSSRFNLYRARGDGLSCPGTGVRWAEYLTTGAVFSSPVANPCELKTIGVDLPVNVKPNKPQERYRLNDDIVLRNSGRAACP